MVYVYAWGGGGGEVIFLGPIFIHLTLSIENVFYVIWHLLAQGVNAIIGNLFY